MSTRFHRHHHHHHHSSRPEPEPDSDPDTSIHSNSARSHPAHHRSSKHVSWWTSALCSTNVCSLAWVTAVLLGISIGVAGLTIALMVQNRQDATAKSVWAQAGHGPPKLGLLGGSYYLDVDSGITWVIDSAITPETATAAATAAATAGGGGRRDKEVKAMNAWTRIPITLSGDVSGTTDSVVVSRIGNVSTDYVVQAATLVYQNATGGAFNGTTLALGVNSVLFPASSTDPTPDARIYWSNASEITLDSNKAHQALILKLNGTLFLNGVDLWQVISQSLSNSIQSLDASAQSTADNLMTNGIASNALPRPVLTGPEVPGTFAVFNDSTGSFVVAASGISLHPDGSLDMSSKQIKVSSVLIQGVDLNQTLVELQSRASGTVYGPADGNVEDAAWQIAVFNSSTTSQTLARSAIFIYPNGTVGDVSLLVTAALQVGGISFQDHLALLRGEVEALIPANKDRILYGPVVPSAQNSIVLFANEAGNATKPSVVSISDSGIVAGVASLHVEHLFIQGQDIYALLANASDSIVVDVNMGIKGPEGWVADTAIVLFLNSSMVKESVVRIDSIGVVQGVKRLHTESIVLNGTDLRALIDQATGEQDLSLFVRGPPSGLASPGPALAVWTNGSLGRDLEPSLFVVSGRNLSGVDVFSADRILVNGTDLKVLIAAATNEQDLTSFVQGPPTPANSTIAFWISGGSGRQLAAAEFVVAGRNLSNIDALYSDRLFINGANVLDLIAAATNEQDLSALVRGPVAAPANSTLSFWTNGNAREISATEFLVSGRNISNVDVLHLNRIILNGLDLAAAISAATNEQDLSQLIKGPATGLVQNSTLAFWVSNTGRDLASTGFAVSGRNLSNIGTLSSDKLVVNGQDVLQLIASATNEQDLSSFVRGPASVTNSTLAFWIGGTNGRDLASTGFTVSGRTLANIGSIYSDAVFVNGTNIVSLIAAATNEQDLSALVRGPVSAPENSTLSFWTNASTKEMSSTGFVVSGRNLSGIDTLSLSKIVLNGQNLADVIAAATNEQDLSQLVKGPVSGSVQNSTLAIWSSPSGRLITDSGLVVSGRNLSNIATLVSDRIIVNGMDVAAAIAAATNEQNLSGLVAGPASGSVLNSTLAFWVSGTGRSVGDTGFVVSGRNISNIGTAFIDRLILNNTDITALLAAATNEQNLASFVAGPVAPVTDGHVPVWDTSSARNLKSSLVLISGQNMTVPGALITSDVILAGASVASSLATQSSGLSSVQGSVASLSSTVNQLSSAAITGSAPTTDSTLMAWNGTNARYAKGTVVSVSSGGNLATAGTVSATAGFISNSLSASGNVLLLNAARGVVFPSVTAAARLAFTGDYDGQIVFDSTYNAHFYWADSNWNTIGRTITKSAVYASAIAGTTVSIGDNQYRYNANAASGNIEMKSISAATKTIRWGGAKYTNGLTITTTEVSGVSVNSGTWTTLNLGGASTTARLVYMIWDPTSSLHTRIEVINVSGTTIVCRYDLN